MSERKSGPVKPPVIDLTARDATPPPEQAVPEPPSEAGEQAAVEADLADERSSAPPGADAPQEFAESGGAAESEPPVDRDRAPSDTIAPLPQPERRTSIWPAAIAGSIGGALLGTALTYSLMSSGMMPLPPAT